MADVTVTEATNISAASAPDGSTVIDLHGMLYRVPAGGGTATQLSKPEHEVARPDVGPDGRIVYQSYDGGDFDIWVANPDGTNPEKITDGIADYREPRWSPDGQHIVFSSDRVKGSYDIWSIELATGEFTQWTNGKGDESQPSWSPSGDEVIFINQNSIAAVDRQGSIRQISEDPGEKILVHAPSMSPDGQTVVWIEHNGNVANLMVNGQAITNGEDVFPFTPDWTSDTSFKYTANGKIWERNLGSNEVAEIPFEATLNIPGADYEKRAYNFDDTTSRSATILTPQISPDGKSVIFIALGDVWHMNFGEKPVRITDDDFHDVDPVFSPDGKTIAWATDRSGTQDIYTRNLESGEEKIVTTLPGAEVAPAFSPDGKQLAFQDQDGATYLLNLENNTIRELIPKIFGPGRPSWSADGKTITLAAVKVYSERFREGTSQILTVNVDSGEQTFQAPGAEDSSLSTRGDDGPAWSPDGTSLAFISNSLLHTMPVDEQGNATGDPKVVNNEIADAPSWSGDSSKLLYLSNGALKLADAATGESTQIDVPLEVNPHIEEGVKTIQAGAIWDGTSESLRENVDIVVRDNRIESISARGENKPQGEVIDATDLTIMPGLFDAHIHQGLQSRFQGDRQGRTNLAYGVTSTMSMGDQAYRALEERDSIDAGERVGPRFFATGEPIDGSRVYYNFMRPTNSDEDVQRELDRAAGMNYDFYKTYVRLPASGMKKVIDTAHSKGIPSGSHYMSPGMFLGQDGTTHLAATQRLGFARTMSKTGQSYDDIPAMYAGGNRFVMSTLFSTDFVGADEFANDPRMDLMPTWIKAKLDKATSDNLADPSDPNCATAECRETQTLLKINEAGGQVMVGTDAPLDYVGLGMQTNLRELVGYGWSPYDALRAATSAPAQFLGIDKDLGTLEPGKIADLIAVRGNPLEDIDSLINVELTMVGGKAYTQDDLIAPFDPNVEQARAAGADATATRVTEFANAAVVSPEHLRNDGHDGHAH
ncbi:amidohydrolase family protein [Corynebacterium sp. S7]